MQIIFCVTKIIESCENFNTRVSEIFRREIFRRRREVHDLNPQILNPRKAALNLKLKKAFIWKEREGLNQKVRTTLLTLEGKIYIMATEMTKGISIHLYIYSSILAYTD